jgi:iron(III) transport system permease protein
VARRPLASATKGAARATVRPLPRRAWLLVGPALALVLLLTLLPHLSVALVAFSDKWFFSILPERFTLAHFADVMTDETAYFGVRNSLTYASCSTAIDLGLGLVVAWLVVRTNSRIARWLDACAMLPLALPGVVLAFGYANCFTGTPLEPWLDPLKNPMLLIVFGYAMRRLPYVVRAADAGLRQVPVAFEEAAHGLGASGVTTVRRVTAPLLAASLLAGGLLAFSFAMLEVSESLILAPSKESYPIAKAIYILLADLTTGPQIGSALGVIGTAILLYALLVASRLLGRTFGEMFRA